MSDRYRWNAEKTVWEFNVPSWGGWLPLRVGTHVSSRPMTFEEGRKHIAARDPAALTEPGVKVEAFNAAYPVGTKVIIERRGEKEETRTRAPAELLSGHTAIVWVEASSSCISLDHVEIVSEETGPGGTSLEGVYFEIQQERARQDAQWGGPSVDDERDAPHWSRVRTKFEMRLIAAARGALVSNDDIDVERDSLIKLAALCVAQVESRDRIERRVERLVEETENER